MLTRPLSLRPEMVNVSVCRSAGIYTPPEKITLQFPVRFAFAHHLLMFKTIVTHILRLHLVFQAESQRANDNNDDDDNDADADADDAAAIERVNLHPHPLLDDDCSADLRQRRRRRR